MNSKIEQLKNGLLAGQALLLAPLLTGVSDSARNGGDDPVGDP